MADVLLVHVREDETLADSIGISLERSGLTVARGESVFDVGDEVPCVVVLWSDVSTRSSMVRDVAIRAQREGKLVAATLGGCETPLGFSRPAPHDLSEWGGDPDDPTLDALFFAADRLVCAAKLNPPAARARQAQPYAQRPAPPRAAQREDERYEPRPAPRELPEAPLRPRAAAPAPAPSPEPAAGGDLPPNLTAETLAWKQIEQSKNPQDFLDYLTHYGPKGMFSELASMKLDKLTHASRAPAKGSFIAHKPTPHVEKTKSAAKAPPPKPAPPRIEPRPAPEPRRPEPALDSRPEPGAEPRFEPRPEPRFEPRLSEIRRPDPEATPGRTRVATAARRRIAPPPQTRPAETGAGGGIPWRPILLVAILGAGGFAVYKNLPKLAPAHHPSAASSALADALRAGPEADAVASPVQSAPAIEASPTAVDYAAPAPKAPAPSIAKKPAVKLADARPRRAEGQGGPILTMAPRESGGGKAKDAEPPPPVVNFHPVGPAAPAPQAAAPIAPVVAPAASMDPAPPAQTRYVHPRWVLQPSASRLARFYPSHADEAGIAGQVTLDCAILQSGRLNCVVQSETPKGKGFGAAAVAASHEYLASPQAADGTMAYGARTTLTIAFQ